MKKCEDVLSDDRTVMMFMSQDSFFISHFKLRTSVAIDCGYKFYLLANKTSEEIDNEIKQAGIKFINSKIDRSGINIFKELASLARTIRIIKKYKPSLIHNYGAKSIFYGTIACRLVSRKTKIVNNLVGLGYAYTSDTIKAKIIRLIMNFGYRLLLNPGCGKVICEHKDDLSYFEKKGFLRRQDAFLIPGAGVDLDKYSPGLWDKKEKEITAVMCTRLLHSKGVEILADAALKLKDKGKAIQVWIIGDVDKDNPDSLNKEEIKNIEKRNCCRFLGYRTDVCEILKKCHIAVLLSKREGLPLALIEAAASGLCIVCADTVGCRDIVSNGNGILIHEINSSEVANVLGNLAENPQKILAMGINSRKLACENYGYKIIGEQIVRIYNGLIGCELN